MNLLFEIQGDDSLEVRQWTSSTRSNSLLRCRNWSEHCIRSSPQCKIELVINLLLELGVVILESSRTTPFSEELRVGPAQILPESDEKVETPINKKVTLRYNNETNDKKPETNR
mmetsp:Transcript_52148/g.59586  ORF Transcript_52148/g.59586 Transcript_52148/m.59586 type:complete len:114 (-) Transcript_52148:245-586(-)